MSDRPGRDGVLLYFHVDDCFSLIVDACLLMMTLLITPKLIVSSSVVDCQFKTGVEMKRQKYYRSSYVVNRACRP
jgi:hypothetical protein